MGSRSLQFSAMLLIIIALSASIMRSSEALSANYYVQSCPDALYTIRRIVEQAVRNEPRMGASLLRLHFHDCFVNGCDGSNLLDDTRSFQGEKTARPNLNSLRGFEVIDQIKSTLNSACGGNVVSCADIVAVAARDSVNILGGPSYPVYLGRLDSRTASLNDANNHIPAPFFSLQQLINNFQNHNLNLQDLVVLSGGHTIGVSRCALFLPRLANDSNINAQFKATLQQGCPNPAAQNNNTTPLDSTTNLFDTAYFQNLLQFKGLLHSDQELFKNDGSKTDKLVQFYSNNPRAFWYDFGVSMIKMGNLSPPSGTKGEVRLNCRRIN
ncbi:OLC1v1006406C1 [Oldenlandia corymbosa var. corymbosa]|uniref:Peroxidase n=1 Tax=Oldenlandia corymbosa var. corymbosa TaxID=529605 RepID=A0AAV1DHJ6_OLDCO|nr:OLC1v1006406C1 [Oldenlandia corymbosa var. corymbosa]